MSKIQVVSVLVLLVLGCHGPPRSMRGNSESEEGTSGGVTTALPAGLRPQDVPSADPIRVGLAGGDADIVRYLMVRRATSPSIAPDGSRVAYRTSTTGAPQIWMVNVEGGAPDQRTFGEPVTFHAFSPAGNYLLYGTDRGGNEREGFYLMTPDGRRERELLPPSESFRIFGGFSRDGGRIAYATTPPGSDRFDIHVMDIESGADRRVLEGRLGLDVAAWRPDGGALVLAETRGEDANDLHLLDLTSGELTTLFAPEDDPSVYASIEWLPDSSGFYLITDQGRDFAGLAFYRVGDGDLSWVATPDRDVEDVAVSDDGRFLIWTENDGGFSRLRGRRLDREQELEIPELPAGIYGVHFAAQAHRVAVSVRSPRVPGDIWVWDVEGGQAERVTRSSLAGLDAERLVIPTHETFRARDGVTLRGLLSMPPGIGDGDAPPPVLISVHGGPTAQARPGYSADDQYLLARGIAVFALNFRGSTGYGKTFARLDNGRLRPNAVRDVEDTLRWLADDGRVDASRAAVMGGSYGGYLTFAALVTFPEAFRGGVSFVGVSNWITALEGASPQLRASDRLEYGDIDDPDDRAFFEELSPITHIDNIRRPLLVSHGANDPRDPVTESDRFVTAARERGVDVEYLRFADEGHGVRHLRNRVHLYRRVAAFLERVLRE